MGKYSPVRATQTGGLQRRTLGGTRIIHKVEDAVFEHDVFAGGDLRMESTDAMVTGVASRINLEEELKTLRLGRLESEPDDPFAKALVMQRVDEQSQLNTQRLRRKFG